jgi:hypothetical protein
MANDAQTNQQQATTTQATASTGTTERRRSVSVFLNIIDDTT